MKLEFSEKNFKELLEKNQLKRNSEIDGSNGEMCYVDKYYNMFWFEYNHSFNCFWLLEVSSVGNEICFTTDNVPSLKKIREKQLRIKESEL